MNAAPAWRGSPGTAPPIDAFLGDLASTVGKQPKSFGPNAWQALCPAHDDRNPSLSIGVGGEDGRILLHCHAGCDPRDVVDKVGWEMADLFPKNDEPIARPVARSRPTKATRSEYLYADEDGQTLFRVVVERQPSGDKKVTQHAALPDGGWARSLGKARRVLYRLPAVMHAKELGAPILLVEGEKCVEAVESLGLTATTNPGGAGKWDESYTASLTGATVVVIPDNDGPGVAHAEAVSSALEATCDVVLLTLPGLPEKGDIADWVDAGGTRTELDALIRAARFGGPATVHVSEPEDRTFPVPVLDERALHGVFGEAISLLDGVSESDPAAVLLHLLIGFGSLVGPNPYVAVGTAKATANTFGVVVGASAKARKGTAWSDARTILEATDDQFLVHHHATGLSTGEGLIYRLRDADEDQEARDPRLLIIEPEFGKVLRQNQRQGNTLSGVVRQAWDNDPLQTLTRQDPLMATRHHLGIVGHVTSEELLAELDSVSAVNGFANRFLYAYVQRTKYLPEPAAIDAYRLDGLGAHLRAAAFAARDIGEVRRTPAAKERWAEIYQKVEVTVPLPGLAGHLTDRGVAQVLRLALIYALADNASAQIDVEHLEAAYAMWRFSEESVRHIFGTRLGNPLAEKILKAARRAGPTGLTSREVFEALDRNADAESVERAIAVLSRFGLVERRTVPAGPRGGRPKKVLIATR